MPVWIWQEVQAMLLDGIMMSKAQTAAAKIVDRLKHRTAWSMDDIDVLWQLDGSERQRHVDMDLMDVGESLQKIQRFLGEWE